MRKIFLAFAVVLVLTALGSTVPKAEAANGCPLYRVCEIINGRCTCTGFFCNGTFICGIPVD